MRLAKQQLDVGIVASDPAATCAFYRDLLGFAELPSMPFGEGAIQYRYRIGRHWVKINQLPHLPARERGGIDRAVGIRLLAFVLDELDPVLERLERAGRRHTALRVSAAARYRVHVVKDPEGNVIELIGLHEPAGDTLAARMQIGLTVTDVERSRHFYGQQLGLEEEPQQQVGEIGTRYGFQWGATTVKFWRLPQVPPAQTGAPSQRAGLRLITAMVEDLDEAHAFVLERKIPIAMSPTRLGNVARIMFIADPDGNWLELAQRL